MSNGTFYERLISAHRHRGWNQLTFRAVLWLAVNLGVLLVLLAGDNLFNLSQAFRSFGTVLFLAANAVALSLALIRFLRRRLDMRKAALDMEKWFNVTDNCLINAVEFARDGGVADDVRAFFLDQAGGRSRSFDMKKLWNFKRLKRGAVTLLAIGGGFLVYVIVFSRHAENALVRYLNPRTGLTPLNYTQFEVTPGSARVPEGAGVEITARAVKHGISVNRLELLVRPEGGQPVLYTMRDAGALAAFNLERLSGDCDYRIRHRRDVSKWYRIRVARRPSLEAVTVSFTPPDYSSLPHRNVSIYDRQVDVLKGGAVTVRASYREGEKVTFTNERGKSADGQLSFTVEDNTVWRMDVTDRLGLLHPSVWSCRFSALDDQAPGVRFLNRELNYRLPAGDSLDVHIRAEDDCGLRGLELFTTSDDQEFILKKWAFSRVVTDRREVAFVAIDPAVFAVNSTYKIYARGLDNYPGGQTGITALPLVLHVTDPAREAGKQAEDDEYTRIFSLLGQALAAQKNVRTLTAARVRKAENNHLINRLADTQNQHVHYRILQAKNGAATLSGAGNLAVKLSALSSGVSAKVLTQFNELKNETNLDKRKIQLNEIAFSQGEVVRHLQELLGFIGQKRVDAKEADKELDEDGAEKELFDRLTALRDDLDTFKDEQKELMEKLEDIDKKEPEDWTQEEEALLGELAAKQNDMANFFKAAFNDLSKLENQDFSNSMMAEELIEMYEELQKSGEALAGKQVEIATIAEQMGAEMAESIETNIERWLADQKDTKKWNAEEPETMPDVPLQDLPEELTDIIGDLIDSVEDMTESEDSTNSYLGSFDEGIGWGVSDGNIDDMSAKGITGNIMPNDNEVGGRSGEGRSGKSSGQFVEETATGKGGRDTPTRLTQSPFETGTVNDMSTDPQGGATGGGKQSGTGGEGLRGITPDQDPNLAERLPGNQIELKQRAEALVRKLSVQNLPTGDLEEAIAAMETIQRNPRRISQARILQVKSDIVSALRDARAAVTASLSANLDRSHRQGEGSGWSVKHHSEESVPPGYESTVEAYFRGLAE